jgi:hypothetical protein
MFGCVDNICGKKMVPSYTNRRKKVIEELVDERRGLRRSLRMATTNIDKNHFQALLKTLAQKLSKLRAAEKRREKQRTLRKQRGLFKKTPTEQSKAFLLQNQLAN